MIGLRFAGIVGAALLASGCGHQATTASQDVRSAAAVDLDCDPSEIKLDERRPQQTIASGCGKEQIYRYKCFGAKSDKKDCKWVPIADPGN
jgi:hypothetical protein